VGSGLSAVLGAGVCAEGVEVPHAWTRLSVKQLRGTLIVVGAPDVGKSTFGRYLVERLRAASVCTAYLDGDPGQSIMGPPTTMAVSLGVEPGPPVYRRFVGAVSPRGHMLPSW
jgi:polynucleotide 5'-hydroxyl-kinase GRC3/NOL9